MCVRPTPPPSFALQEVFPQADHTALDTSDRHLDRQSPDSAVRTVMNTRTGATSPAFTTTLSGISTTRSSAQGLAAGQGLASGQALAQGRSF